MICDKCGKELDDECLFCTECGNRVGMYNNRIQSNGITKNNGIIENIKSFIDGLGETDINKYMSVAAIVFIIFIRLLGIAAITVLITIINAVLIYYNYIKNSKVDINMILWSIAVLVAGILMAVI